MLRTAGYLRSVLEDGFHDRWARDLYRASAAAVWFFYPFGIPFVAFGLLPAQFSWTGSAVIALYALAALGSELRSRPTGKPLAAFAVLSIALFGVEYAGATTGIPFGSYSYTDVLGARVAGVPIAMALAWYVTVVSTWRIAQRLVGGTGGSRTLRVALLGAVLTVLLDFALEPMASMVTRYWVWEGGEVPAMNYAAWFAFSFAAALALEAALGRPAEHPGLFLNAAMLYLMQWTLFALTSALGGYLVPVLISAAGLALTAVMLRRRFASALAGSGVRAADAPRHA
jgi:putative membrane protein